MPVKKKTVVKKKLPKKKPIKVAGRMPNSARRKGTKKA